MDLKKLDPKGLMREVYRMEGITAAECRSVFLDWALGVPAGTDPRDSIRALLEHYGTGEPNHPMTVVLTDGLGAVGQTGRRGGRAARVPRDPI